MQTLPQNNIDFLIDSSPENCKKPELTVVIPCHNAKRWISATLRSVLAQNWPNIEIIVIDDGSSDGSADLVRSEFPNVILIQQHNQGVAAARNKGITSAAGDWIAFIDADDIWLPGKLEAQWHLLSTQPLARVAYSAWHVWHSIEPEPAKSLVEKLEAENAEARQHSGPSGWIYPELLEDCCVWTSTVIAHRSIFDEVGIFDQTLRIGEDYDLWLRASRVTPILRVPLKLALYRMHPNSITRSAPTINFQALVIARAVERWGLKSPDGRRANKRTVTRALSRTWRDFAGAHLAAGNYKLARYGGLMAVRNDWRQRQGWKLLVRSIIGSIAGSAAIR